MNKIVVLALLAMVSSPAFAVIPAQVLNVSMTGTITAVCTYAFGPIGSVASPTSANVATVTLLFGSTQETLGNLAVICNDSAGYTVSASSVNGSTLKSGTNSIPYTIGTDTNTPASISPSAAILTKLAGGLNEWGALHPVKINYSTNPSAPGSIYPSGTYTDTIMLSMQAN